MDILITPAPISPLRHHDDRRHDHAPVLTRDPAHPHPHRRAVRHPCGALAATATVEDLRRFQVGQQQASVPVPTMNGIVSALWFFSRRRSTKRSGAVASIDCCATNCRGPPSTEI